MGPTGFARGWARLAGLSRRAALALSPAPGAMFHDARPVTPMPSNAASCAWPPEGVYTLGSPAVWRQLSGWSRDNCRGRRHPSIALGADGGFCSTFWPRPHRLAGRARCPRCRALCRGAGSGPFRLGGRRGRTACFSPGSPICGRRPNQRGMRISQNRPRGPVGALCKGGADAADLWILPQSAVLPHHDATRVAVATPVSVIFMMNAAQGPLRDPRLRRALSLALDRQALITSAAAGAGLPLAGFIRPSAFRSTGT